MSVRFLPSIVGLIAFVLSAVGGTLLLAYLTAPKAQVTLPPTTAMTVLPPEPLLPTPEPRDQAPDPTPDPQPLAPSLALPAPDLPPMPLALNLPAVDHDHAMLSAWEPTPTTIPSPVSMPSASQFGDGQQGMAAIANDRGPRRQIVPDLTAFYPHRARRRGTEGSTRLQITIDPNGVVISVKILQSNPPGIFERAAEQAAFQLRYDPALRAGEAVRATVIETFSWTLRK